MQRRNAFELVCEPERGLRTQHANESVAVCDMMSCRIELQKRCTNEHTIYTHAAIHTQYVSRDGEGGRCICYVARRFTRF